MTENTPIFTALGVLFSGIIIGVLGSKIYRKWRKKKQHEQEVFHQAHLDEIEAQKLHDKLVDSRVEIGVKPPKAFKTKRTPQDTKILGKKSVKKTLD